MNGWYTTPEGGVRVTEDYVFGSDTKLYAHWNLDKYQVNLTVEDPEYGSLSPDQVVNQKCGTLYSVVSDDRLNIDGIDGIYISPIPSEPSDGCTYEFVGWYDGDNPVTTGTIVNPMTFTAKFIKYCSVSLEVFQEGYGSLDVTEIADQLEGTGYSAEGNVLTIGTIPITATPAEASEGYAYQFVGWFDGDAEVQSGTINTGINFVAKFIRYCPVTLAVSPAGFGSLDVTTVDSQPEGTHYAVDGDQLIIDTVTVTPAPAEPGEGYTYQFVGWFVDDTEIHSGDIDSAVTFTARFAKCYPVSLEVFQEGWGSLDVTNIDDQAVGTQYSADGDVLTIGSVSITATPAEPGEGRGPEADFGAHPLDARRQRLFPRRRILQQLPDPWRYARHDDASQPRERSRPRVPISGRLDRRY